MLDEEPDILEALEEHNFECESVDDLSDFELDSDILESSEEDTFHKDSPYVDYEG